MSQKEFNIAIELIDEANSKDPNKATADDKDWPKELLYSHRMSEMIEHYAPEADDAMKLAMRAQHIQRWKLPRSNYPMNRKGYHQWRTKLYQYHADTAAELLKKAGYDEAFIERVKLAVSKKSLKSSPDTQLLENISAMVFIEFYMLNFVDKHPEYSEEKWLEIIRKTWNKMSSHAQQFVLDGNIKLPGTLAPLIQKAVAD
jgi:hypothetical protein